MFRDMLMKIRIGTLITRTVKGGMRFARSLSYQARGKGVLDSAAAMTHRIAMGNAGITRFKFDGSGWRVISVNDEYHLRSLHYLEKKKRRK